MTPLTWVVLCALCLSLAAACGPATASPPPAAAPGAPATGAMSGSAPASTAQGTTSPVDSPAARYLAKPGEPAASVKIGLCGVNGGNVFMYVARDADTFSKYGLNVELVNTLGGAASMAALGSNEIQGVYCAVDAIVGGLASGFPGKLVAASQVGQPFVLMARTDIRSVADLRGKTVGTSRAGGLAHKLTERVMEKHGFVVNRDVDVRPLGGSQADVYAGLIAGVVQAAVIAPPLDAQARREGLHVIYDLADLGEPAIDRGLLVSSAMIQSSPQLIQRLVAGLADAMHYADTHPEAAKQSIGRVLNVEDPDSLESAYQAYARKMIHRRLTVPLEIVAENLQDVREAGTSVTVSRPEEIVDNSFANDLEQTGFLAQLWGAALPAR